MLAASLCAGTSARTFLGRTVLAATVLPRPSSTGQGTLSRAPREDADADRDSGSRSGTDGSKGRTAVAKQSDRCLGLIECRPRLTE